ncbi:MAG: Kiwa anti-phage protein KwaB-like domain-containing protein [Arcobacteraceae bacterium]
MTKAQINGLIGLVSTPQTNVSLYVFLDKKTQRNRYQLFRLSIDIATVEAIKEVALKSLSKAIAIIDEMESDSVPDFNHDLEQDFCNIPESEVEQFTEIKSLVIGDNPVQYAHGDVNEEKIRSWIIRFEYEESGETKNIFFFQRFYPSKMLKSKMINMFTRNGTFELLTSNMMSIGENIDFISIDGNFIALNRTNFEIVFGFNDIYTTSANTFITQALSSNTIGAVRVSNFHLISQKMINNLRYSRKLHRILKNGYYRDIQLDKLKDLNTRKALGLIFNANNELEISEDMRIDILLNILNDDYSKSEITNNEYRTDAKEKLV